MHNMWLELLLTMNDSGATHFCVTPTARERPGVSYDLTLAAPAKKKSKKAARGSDLNRTNTSTDSVDCDPLLDPHWIHHWTAEFYENDIN